VALSLLEAVEAADLPSLRAGVAWGSAEQRAGDFYGHAVNLASRVTGVARPGSVLCTEEVRDAAPAEFDWSFARRHRLKGMSETFALYRARRRESDSDDTRRSENAKQNAETAETPKRKSKADRRRTRAQS
jgi:adenylate cyclase